MQDLEFDLNISAADYLARYRTPIDVLVVAKNGQTLRFPANSLQPFVTTSGVHGSFRIRFDQQYRLVDLSRVPVK